MHQLLFLVCSKKHVSELVLHASCQTVNAFWIHTKDTHTQTCIHIAVLPAMANLMGPQVGQQANFSGGIIDQQGVEVQRRFVEFLQTFTVDDDILPTSQMSQHSQQQLLEYVDQALNMKNEEDSKVFKKIRDLKDSF